MPLPVTGPLPSAAGQVSGGYEGSVTYWRLDRFRV